MAILHTETKTGETRKVGDFQLTPLTRVLKVQGRSHHFGFVWNHPKAIIVRAPDGQEQILPVTDFSRIAIWSIIAGGLLGAILVSLLFWKK
jgi:hypothetical protein